MKVSILVPVYNREHLVIEALRSAMIQTYPDIEILVFDDGSTDHTRRNVTQFVNSRDPGQSQKVEILWVDKNVGHGRARKVLVEAAHGDLMAWLDSDDKLHPERIAKQVAHLRETGADVCFSDIQFFGQRNTLRRINISRWRINAPTLHEAIHNNTNTATACGNRKAFDLVLQQAPIDHGGWDTIWSWAMIAAGCTFTYIPEALYYCRHHHGRIVRRKGTPAWKAEQAIIRRELIRLNAPGLEGP